MDGVGDGGCGGGQIDVSVDVFVDMLLTLLAAGCRCICEIQFDELFANTRRIRVTQDTASHLARLQECVCVRVFYLVNSDSFLYRYMFVYMHGYVCQFVS